MNNSKSAPLEFWADKTDTLDKGKCWVLEESIKKPKCWDEQFDNEINFHLIEYSAYAELQAELNRVTHAAERHRDLAADRLAEIERLRQERNKFEGEAFKYKNENIRLLIDTTKDMVRERNLIDALKILASGILPNGDHVDGATVEYVERVLKDMIEKTKE